MVAYLKNNPIVGVVSGFGSGVLLSIRVWFTDELVLKFVAAIGTWSGAAVALLTLVIWAVKTYDTFKLRFKK